MASEKEFRKWRRVHGLQFPLHPQQGLCWIFLLVFTLYKFLALIPALHSSFQLPLIIINAFIFIIHYITHLTSLLIDPSDPNLLALHSKKPVPELDKSKHSHVIENGRCHLCNITITHPELNTALSVISVSMCLTTTASGSTSVLAGVTTSLSSSVFSVPSSCASASSLSQWLRSPSIVLIKSSSLHGRAKHWNLATVTNTGCWPWYLILSPY